MKYWEIRKQQFKKTKQKSLKPVLKFKVIYNGEFDPGSGWTLAAGLTHASRGAA